MNSDFIRMLALAYLATRDRSFKDRVRSIIHDASSKATWDTAVLGDSSEDSNRDVGS